MDHSPEQLGSQEFGLPQFFTPPRHRAARGGEVLPKTAQGVKEGNKVFGAAVLRSSAAVAVFGARRVFLLEQTKWDWNR